MSGLDARNREDFNGFLCVSCRLILCNPAQLPCGHRICRACICELSVDSADNIMCAICHIITKANEITADRGCYNDMQSLIVQCISCHWADQFRNYEKHLETCPQTRDEIPIRMGQARPSNSVGEISTDENEPESEDLRRSIQMLEAIVQNISEDTEQFRRDLRQMRSCLLNVFQKLDELRVAEHEFNTVLANQENLLQQLASLKQQVSESQQSSFEGTYLWVINDVGTKMSTAEHAEEPECIHSPAIYSSLYGNGLRAQLFLNGDANARGTHLSLRFVLQHSKYSPILLDSSGFNVIFCLYDQSDAKHHIIHCFKLDSTLYNFQSQSLSINLPDEFSNFCPLTMLRQENSPYTKDNTMFIRIMFDFCNFSHDMIHFVLNLNPGLPNYIQHKMIQDEINRRAQ